MFKKICLFLGRPFTDGLWFMMLLWLLSSSASCYYWVHEGNLVFALDYAARGLIVDYLLTLTCGSITKWWQKILAGIYVILGIINLMVDKGTYNICHTAFTMDTVGLIYGTNVGETSEFISAYITKQVVLFIILVLLLCAAIYGLRKIITNIAKYVSWFAIICVVASVCFVSLNNLPKDELEKSRWESVFVCKANLFRRYQKPEDLRKYRHYPDVIVNGDMPQNIIFVIGESVTKSHFSLYGDYNQHNTTPLLLSLSEQDSLIAYTNVTSAYYNTGNSFKMMLSRCNSCTDEQWYEYLTIFDLAKALGYITTWISNQSPSGFFDNPVANYSRLADTTIFVGNKYKGRQKQDYDELLIDAFKGLPCDGKANITFIHMMGCHPSYDQRYSEDWAVFEPSDYSDIPLNQRESSAKYDNAVLYNDFVVYKLIESVRDKEAILLFFPDHGLDFYKSDENYAGHARSGDPSSVEYGRQIPFVIYGSSLYRQRFANNYSLLEERKDTEFNTTNLMDLLLQICNSSCEQ